MSEKCDLRRAQILEILQKQNVVEIETLVDILKVSSTTVRNDLRKLEYENLIFRLHGKVFLRGNTQISSHITHVSDGFCCSFMEEMLYIGEITKTLVKPGDWIFLGCGMTCAAIAYALLDRQINVITNNMYVASILSKNILSEVLLTGGYLSGPTHSFLSGDKFSSSLQDITVKKAFIGASGVDVQFGFSISNLIEKSIYLSIRPIAKEIIVVADSSKFGKTSFMSIGNLDIADTIISDTGVPDYYVNYCAEHNIQLLTSIKDQWI